MNDSLYLNFTNPEFLKIDEALNNQTYYEFVRTNCFSVSHNFIGIFGLLIVFAIFLFIYSHSDYLKTKTWYYTALYPMITFFCLMNVFVYIALLFLILG